MNLGGAELLILVGIAVLIFGAGWLPKAARNLGKAKVEFDEVQRQLNEAKDSVVEQSGVRELEATVRKANKVMSASPQKLMRDAAKSAVAGGTAAKASDDEPVDDAGDAAIEDAEIIEPADEQDTPRSAAPGDSVTEVDDPRDTNINIDFT